MTAGQIPSDVIGTNPHYAPIADHVWLSVDSAYDNYPSDNNPVRIQPKLAEIWGTPQAQSGVMLIPNSTMSTMGPVPVAASSEIVKEAKKAMMLGLTGYDLGNHLRARFTQKDIAAARDDLQKLSSEQGLLGNVYIDASAFSTANEFDAFLARHRNRLAQDVVLAETKLTPEVVTVLASKYHKNVCASVTYAEPLFAKYRQHLVAAGKISKDAVIDSKESLRRAFMSEPEPVAAVVEEKPVEKLSQESVQKVLSANAEKSERLQRLALEEMDFDRVKAIVVFAREQMAKGKTGSDLKEILRTKYVGQDLKVASKYIAMVVSDGMFGDMDKLVEAGRLSEKSASSIKKIVTANPIKKASVETVERERSVGVPGYLYTLVGKSASAHPDFRAAAVEALRRGKTLEEIRVAMKKKLSTEDTDQVLAEAMNDFNAVGAGVKANKEQKVAKTLIEDLPEKETLPSSEQAKQASVDFAKMFDGADLNVPVDAPRKVATQTEVQDMFNMSGIDSFFRS